MAVVAAKSHDASSSAAPQQAGTTAAKKSKKSSAPQSQLVDINSASKAQLKKLPDIGDAEADKIIAARPFLSKADLVTKGVLSSGAYYSVKTKIIARQPAQPKSGKSATGAKK
jgi:DNA uptake protein ComE-like DNA-binding protein